jgi:DNA-(apurinic or apyrimidinic site) lyase
MNKNEKIEELIKILKQFNYNDIRYIEEKLDKQYVALSNLYKNLKDPLLFFKLVLINSLLSYQLSMRGEEYWTKFSEFFSNKKDLTAFEEFLKKYNKRFLNTKLKRLEKVKKFVENLTLKDFDLFIEEPNLYLEKISSYLNQDKSAKTLVFSLKMLFYAYRIVSNEFKKFPFGIMIPLDVRIKKISDDKEFWKKLENKVGIPLLHLDAILWVSFGLKEEELNKIKDENLKKKIKKLKMILNYFN